MQDRGGLVGYTCSCRLGFLGPLCLTPQDNACLPNPCRNGGTCDLLTLADFKCLCPPGWSGEAPRFLWTLGTGVPSSRAAPRPTPVPAAAPVSPAVAQPGGPGTLSHRERPSRVAGPGV